MKRIACKMQTVMLVMTAALLSVAASGAQAQTQAPPQPIAPIAPISVDPANPHYFRYAGHTIALVTSGEHYGAVINPRVDQTLYLETLKADHLNLTRLFGGSYVEAPGKSFGIRRNDLAPEPGEAILPWARSAQPGYAGGGNRFDLDHWNPEYFRRLDSFLAAAEQHGVIVELTLFSAQYNETQWALSPFNAANNINDTPLADWKRVNTPDNGRILRYQEAYTRRLVQAAAAYPNVIFEIDNEPWSDRPQQVDVVNPYLFRGRDEYPNSLEVPDAEGLAFERLVAGWIASEEQSLAHRHLIAQNYTNFRYPVGTLLPGVSVVNFHYAYPEAVTWNEGLKLPLAYDETGFLGQSDAGYLRQAWNFMMAGGASFDGLDYSFTPGHSAGDDTAANGPGGGSPTLRHELGLLAEWLNRLPLASMHPDDALVVHADGSVPHVLGNRAGIHAGSGALWVGYLDGRAQPGDQMRLALPAGRYRVSFVSPETGETLHTATVTSQVTSQVTSTGSTVTLALPEFAAGIAFRVEPVA